MAEHDDQTVDDLDQRIAELEAELERLEPYEALYRRRADVGHGDQAEALMKRAEAAEAEMKQANDDADVAVEWQQFYMDKAYAAKACLHDAAETIERQATELARMREALEFYATPDTYFAIGFFPDPPCGEFMEDFEELSGDLGHPDGSTWVKPGKHARQALAADPGEPTGDWLLRIFKTLPPEEVAMLRAAIGEEPPIAAVAERQLALEKVLRKALAALDGRLRGIVMMTDDCEGTLAAQAIREGDELLATARIAHPGEPSKPQEFDPAELGVSLGISPETVEEIEKLEHEQRMALPRAQEMIRQMALGEPPASSAAVAERRVVETAMKCHNERDGRRLGEHMGAIADACDALAAAREQEKDK